MTNKILAITKSDIQNAGNYMDNNNCLACTAIRRTFKLPIDAQVRATGHEVGFVRPGKRPKTFRFCGTGSEKIANAYGISGKPRPDTNPFRVTLRPISPIKFGIGGWDRCNS